MDLMGIANSPWVQIGGTILGTLAASEVLPDQYTKPLRAIGILCRELGTVLLKATGGLPEEGQ